MISQEAVDRTLAKIIEREGVLFTDNPADRGGPTKFGITLARLSQWRRGKGLPVTTAEDVKALEATEALAIYRRDYIADPGFDAIEDEALFDLVVDSGVNHGPGRAAMWLQEALGVRVDGQIGPVTKLAISRASASDIYRKMLYTRLRFYGRFISRDRTDADRDGLPDAMEFASGWLNRLSEFVLKMPEREA